MQYFGGKFRIRKHVAAEIEAVRAGRDYLEPFCGGLWVTTEVTGRRSAADACLPLIHMYLSMQAGWVPPDELSEGEYQRLKAGRVPSDPLTAFAGFGCSFAGKWFGGYARGSDGRSYATSAKTSLLRKMARCQDVAFAHRDYREWKPENQVVYCDPPYAGTTGCDATDAWDASVFWSVMREWSRPDQGNVVLVSEYAAPEDFVAVWSRETTTGVRTARGGCEPRVEKLFRYLPATENFKGRP